MSAFAALHPLAQVVVDRTDDGSNAAGWLFGIGGVFAIIVLLLFLAALALVIWAIIDLVGNPRIDGAIKIVWAIVIFFIPLIGSIVYLVIGRQASEAGSTGNAGGGIG